MAPGFRKSRFRHEGRYRTLEADRYTLDENQMCVVMANGFIENGYWYQSNAVPQNLADFVTSLGFDVHVLSFCPTPALFSAARENIPVDASFSDIVTFLIPEYLSTVFKNYDSIHLIGHSYGATLLACYLTGYQYNQKTGRFVPEPLHIKERQSQIRSFLSLAGFYGFNWSFFEEDLLRGLLSKLPHLSPHYTQETTSKGLFYLSEISLKVPYLPTSYLSHLAPLAKSRMFRTLMRKTPQNLIPFVFYKNANEKALWDAVFHGSYSEPWETFDTLLSISGKNYKKYWKSMALSSLKSDLSHFNVPACFIQGDRDTMSPPELIKSEAFDVISSAEKSFIVMENTGHQDLIFPKNPGPLYETMNQWLQKHSA